MRTAGQGTAKHERINSILKLLLLVTGIMMTGFWVAASTAGASVNMVTFFVRSLMAAGFVFVVWVFLSVDLSALHEEAHKTAIYKIAMPIVKSDSFIALVLVMFGF